MKCRSRLHRRDNDIVGSIKQSEHLANEKVSGKRAKRLKKSLSTGQGERSSTADAESKIQDFQDALSGKTSESNEMFVEKNEVGKLIHEMSCDEDQPILNWFKEKHIQRKFKGVSPAGSLVQCADAITGVDESDIPISAIDTNDGVKSSPLLKTITKDSGVLPVGNLDQCAEASDKDEQGTPSARDVGKNQNLPFVKCHPVWKSFESMEIFHKTPQKPHFSPLLNCDDDDREGLAIFHMVKYSTTVEKASKLKVSDPASIFEKHLKTLADLEFHGFDVEAVRVHLSELMLKKEREHKLQEESKEVENEIMKIILEKTEVEKEINENDGEMREILLRMRELGEKMRELARKHAAAKSMKKVKDKEISKLQSKLEEIHENVGAIHL